eukprot:14639497-Alexandrium_andersonii.AAC.1
MCIRDRLQAAQASDFSMTSGEAVGNEHADHLADCGVRAHGPVRELVRWLVANDEAGLTAMQT